MQKRSEKYKEENIIKEEKMDKKEKKKKKKLKKNKERKLYKTTILFIVLDILVAICFFILYGPFSYFRNVLVTTALKTKTHAWIAYTFFSEEKVNKINSQFSYIPLTDDVDLDKIVIDNGEKKKYDNEYDKAILTRDKGNKNYKLLNIEVAGYNGYLVAIYNPAKVKLITSKSFNTGSGAEKVKNICERLGGLVCINGGMFQDTTGWGSDIPQGYLIKDGKIIWSDHNQKANLIGFNKDNKLMLMNATGEEAIQKGMRDALEFGPFLIVNGKEIEQTTTQAGGYDRAARVAIAQRKDGVVLFLVTDGVHTKGPTLKEVAQTLSLYGAYNAANLDGGTSSQLVIKGELINTPLTIYGKKVEGGREVVSGWGLIP